MSAVFEEKELGGSIGEKEANGAVPAGEIAGHAATGAHAVDLVDADVSADVKLAPRFDEGGALRFLRE